MQFNLTRFFLEFRIAASGMAWKGSESEGVTAMAAGDIKWAQWVRVARNFQLRIGMKDHRREKFDGFMREVHCLADVITVFLKKKFAGSRQTRRPSQEPLWSHFRD